MTGKVFRLASQGADVVARDFTKVGAAGEKMGQTVTKGAAGIPPALRAVDAAASQAKTSFEGLAGRAGGLSQVLGALGPAGLAAAAGIGGLLAIGGAASTAAREMLMLEGAAKQAGVSVEFLQEMQFAVRQAGREVTVIEPALKTFAVRLGEIRDGIGQGSLDILKGIGISAEDVAGFKNAEDGLLRIAEAASRVDERTRFNVYDKLGIVDLIPALQGGREGFEKIAAAARAAGVVISNEVVAGAADTARQLEGAQKAIDIQFKQALLNAAPALTELARLAADLATHASRAADFFAKIEFRTTGRLRDQLDEMRKERADLSRRFGAAVESGGVEAFGGNVVSGALAGAGFRNPARDRARFLDAEIARIDAELRGRQRDLLFDRLTPSRPGASPGATPSAGATARGAPQIDREAEALRMFVERLQAEALWRDRVAALSARGLGLTDQEIDARLKLEDTIAQINRAREKGVIATDAEAQAMIAAAQARLDEADAARKQTEEMELQERERLRNQARLDAELAKVAALPADVVRTLEDAFVTRSFDWESVKRSWLTSFRQTLFDVFLGDTLRDFERRFAQALKKILIDSFQSSGQNGGGGAGGGWGNFLGGLFGSFFGARAGGGPVYAGGSYLVGEDGPELVSFGASGFVHSAAATRGAMGGFAPVFAPTIYAPGATVEAVESVRAELRQTQAQFQSWAAGEAARARGAVRDGADRRLRR